jgi:hypothetical protein
MVVNNSVYSTICFLVIIIWTSGQAIIGIMQLSGIFSPNSPLFAITGGFNNPGPYGGFIAIGMAISASWLVLSRSQKEYSKSVAGKTKTILSLVTLSFGIIVLPATFSRAAWFSFAVSMFVLTIAESDVRKLLYNNKALLILFLLLFVLCAGGAFLLKPRSALGRLHIWRIECLSIAERPIIGHGYGTVLGTYGETQAEFFRKKERHEQTIRIAGCPEYAFNEYLKVGVEHGIPAMTVTIVIIVICIRSLVRRSNSLAYGLISLSVFAIFSYPLSLWQFRIAALLIISASVPSAGNMKYVYFITCCIAVFASAKLVMRKPGPIESKYREKYSVGYSLHLSGQYHESNAVLKEGASISSDPMFHNIIGKNLEAMGDIPGAEKEYLQAHCMVPCRLYPLVLLMEMKAREGDSVQAIKIANKAVEIPVNKRNPNMVELHDRVQAFLDSLKAACQTCY